jgi:imidazoleglycerol-phosphate dehydratase / histidinol-phosphatase
MRSLHKGFQAYQWAPSTAAVAEIAGIDPINVIRFDGNVRARPRPSARPGVLARTLAEVNTYPHGGYTDLLAAIADYAGVSEANIVLGAGADDLIMLTARSFAGPGDTVAIAHDVTYPLFRLAAEIAGAGVVTPAEDAGHVPGSTVLTFCCRPNNPTGTIDELPSERPLVVDEAYYEYAGETAAGLIDSGVVVLRTFSKAFGLAGARVGYALADVDTAAELNRRQSPAPLSTLSAQLAVAGLQNPPDVRPEIEERERLSLALRSLGLDPLPSAGNFVFIPGEELLKLADSLMRRGLVVRPLSGGIRISVRDRYDDDLLLEAIARELDESHRPIVAGGRRARLVRATAETRMHVRLDLDGDGIVFIDTGAGVYDHLLQQLAFHAGMDLLLEGVGDLESGVHHTVEDGALTFGKALDEALGDRSTIARYGHAAVPMDEASATAVVDLAGRPYARVELSPALELAEHLLRSLAHSARICLHVTAEGKDPHHVSEAAFKALGRSLRAAISPTGGGVPSTKGLM